MSAVTGMLVPRLIREAPPPLGLYLRSGFHHWTQFSELIAGGITGCHGVVFDAADCETQQHLIQQVRQRRLDAVLDPQTQQLATTGGYSRRIGKLPWALNRHHRIEDFDASARETLAHRLVDFVLKYGFTAVLAPTHFLSDSESQWLNIDRDLVIRLRAELDRRGSRDVDIYYSLALPMCEFRKPQGRRTIRRALEGLPIDALWFKISLFGSNATGPAFSAYVEATHEFKDSGVPTVSEHTGGLIGLGLLAFNSVGGIAHGILVNEQFDAGNWLRDKRSGGGSSKRTYIPELDRYFTNEEALKLFAARGAKSRFGCKDMSICPNGVSDMIEKPAKHFIRVRMQQVAQLSEAPGTLRVSVFLDRMVRPIIDNSIFATSLKLNDPILEQRLREKLSKLGRLNDAFSALSKRRDGMAAAKAPPTRASKQTLRRPDLPT